MKVLVNMQHYYFEYYHSSSYTKSSARLNSSNIEALNIESAIKKANEELERVCTRGTIIQSAKIKNIQRKKWHLLYDLLTK